MADGFTDLEEKIMAILVKDRKTAAHTIADAHEIAGLLDAERNALLQNDELRLKVYGWLGFWRDGFKPEAVEALQDILGPLEKAKCVCGGVGLGVACEAGCPNSIEKRNDASCTCGTRPHGAAHNPECPTKYDIHPT